MRCFNHTKNNVIDDFDLITLKPTGYHFYCACAASEALIMRRCYHFGLIIFNLYKVINCAGNGGAAVAHEGCEFILREKQVIEFITQYSFSLQG